MIRLLAMLSALLVVNCAGDSPPPAPTPAQVDDPAIPTPLPAASSAPPVKVIVNKFDKANSKELAAVTKPEVTVATIHNIHEADRRARRALTALGYQRAHPTEAALTEAREAVKALENSLEQ